MPINAGPEFAVAQKHYQEASTDSERLAALHEMLTTIPKHKGTEKIQKEIKKKIAKLKEKLEAEKRQRKAAKGKGIEVRKEGAAQIVLVGIPSSGKSTLLSKLTNAKPKIAEYEFTTLEPEIGTLNYEGIPFQIVEVPGLIEGAAEGKGGAKPLLGILRNADILVFVIDLSKDIKQQIDLLKKELYASKIIINKKRPNIEVKGGVNGLEIQGADLVGDEKTIKSIAQSLGIHNALIIIKERISLAELSNALSRSTEYKKAIFVGTKADIAEEDQINIAKQIIPDIIILRSKEDVQALEKKIFEVSGCIRVYSKPPGREAELKEPIVVKKGSTVLDVAKEIHKDLFKNFKYAKVWGSSKFPGQRVSADYEVQDKDIIEIHA